MTLTSASTHVVLGAGPVGSTIARQLAEAGEVVRLVTRTGRDLGVAGVTAFRADITDQGAVKAATAGARTVYFAAQPAYGNWPKGFPPMVDGILGGLRGSGIKLAVIDNLYAYGPTHGAPITESLPYAATNQKGSARAKVAERFVAAHAAGEVQVTIARGSDFFGPEVIESLVGERFFSPILAGKRVQLIGNPDSPHSVTYVPDFARALIELARHDEAFGAVWHVPSVPAVSIRRFSELVGGAGRDAVRVRGAVRSRQFQDRANLRLDRDPVRAINPGDSGLVAVSLRSKRREVLTVGHDRRPGPGHLSSRRDEGTHASSSFAIAPRPAGQGGPRARNPAERRGSRRRRSPHARAARRDRAAPAVGP
jgi:nucleoside-diphosphate-sugar epimerase